MPIDLDPIPSGPLSPQFEYVAIFQDRSKLLLQVASLTGVSTKHGDTDVDRGRLYGIATMTGGDYTVRLYSQPVLDLDALPTASLVASGIADGLSRWFTMTPENASGVSGRCIIAQMSESPATFVIVPTFAVDEDVLLSQSDAEHLPGYDEQHGLAMLHAAAMREILTAALPAALPYLYGRRGAAAFVPNISGPSLPDLTKLANIDQLRVAQASLVKALSAEQQEHQAEFAEISKIARERFRIAMEDLAAGNPEEKTEESQAPPTSGVSFSTFTRG